MALYARLLAKMRCHSVHAETKGQQLTISSLKASQCEIHDICPDEARSSLFKSIDTAQSRAQVAIAQMSVCCRAFLCLLNRSEEVISRDVVVEEERRR